MPMKFSGIPHPIPYQGSKRRLAEEILRYIPSLTNGDETLVEPFCGSAAISIAAAWTGKASCFRISDAHAPLMALWTAILNRPIELADQYTALWNAQRGRERGYFDEVRAEFNQTHQPHHFLYLLARCVKAAIRYNSAGEFNNTPDNRRVGTRPQEMRRRIESVSRLFAGLATFSVDDYRNILEGCTPQDLIYMDPPYQGVCRNRDGRYAGMFDHMAFCDALRELNRRGCRYLVSYDGRTGEKTYGDPLPDDLNLECVEICAGRSTQATLLGRDHTTWESLYLSPALREQLASNEKRIADGMSKHRQTLLF